MEMRGTAGEHDARAWRVRLQLFVVKLAPQPDGENTGYDRVDAVFRVLVRHQLDARGHLDPDDVGPGSEGSPTRIAKRADGGKAGKGFQSISSGRTDLKMAWSG